MGHTGLHGVAPVPKLWSHLFAPPRPDNKSSSPAVQPAPQPPASPSLATNNTLTELHVAPPTPKLSSHPIAPPRSEAKPSLPSLLPTPPPLVSPSLAIKHAQTELREVSPTPRLWSHLFAPPRSNAKPFSPSIPQPGFEFLRLPTEIRLLIYPHILTTPNNIVLRTSQPTRRGRNDKDITYRKVYATQGSGLAPSSTAILRTNSKIHDEALSILYAHNTLVILSINSFETCLAYFGARRRFIKDITLALIYWRDPDNPSFYTCLVGPGDGGELIRPGHRLKGRPSPAAFLAEMPKLTLRIVFEAGSGQINQWRRNHLDPHPWLLGISLCGPAFCGTAEECVPLDWFDEHLNLDAIWTTYKGAEHESLIEYLEVVMLWESLATFKKEDMNEGEIASLERDKAGVYKDFMRCSRKWPLVPV